MLRSFHHFTPAFHEPVYATRARPSLSPASTGVLLQLWSAFLEGLAAHREYERLTARGVPHDQALKTSLGLGVSSRRPASCASAALRCAGKA
jgi:hypothetical protein